MKKKHLDLFSGIGGFALAAAWTELIETIAFCEIDPFCQKVLAKNFKGVPIYEDIRNFPIDAFRGTVDIITGGFPCQPFSVAGKRGGKSDYRYLWKEMFTIIREIKPTWVIAENVPGILNMALESCCVDLEEAGYEVETFILPACGINAPHKRDRVWIIANANSKRSQSFRSKESSFDLATSDAKSVGRQPIPGSVSSDAREAQKRTNEVFKPNSNGETASDSSGGRLNRNIRRRNGKESENGYRQLPKTDRGERTIEPAICGSHDGVSFGLDKNQVAVFDDDWQLGVNPLTLKMPDRPKRLKALGNAIVPQLAYILLTFILESEKSKL